jgi:hypothetical protein
VGHHPKLIGNRVPPITLGLQLLAKTSYVGNQWADDLDPGRITTHLDLLSVGEPEEEV